VGNPPFLGQLGKDTSLDRKTAGRYREVLGPVVRGYVDVAALFFFASVGCLADDGAVALVQPRSIVSAQHAKRVRDSVTSRVAALGVVDTDAALFDAAVDPLVVVAIVGDEIVRCLNRANSPLRVRRDLRPGGRWSSLLGTRDAGPDIVIPPCQTLGQVAKVVADFRDQYYGLRGSVCEGDEFGIEHPTQSTSDLPMLTTCGLIDLAAFQWGRRATRFDGATIQRPVVNRENLKGMAIDDWISSRMVPKVLVATQTRVVEAIADPRGMCVPSVPVLTVFPTADSVDVFTVLAVLHSPVASVWVAQRVAGSALSASALRVSVVELREMPFPIDCAELRAAGECMRRASQAADELDMGTYVAQVEESGRLVHQAFALESSDDEQATEWWRPRWIPRLAEPV
jgi:hypothetical protein